MFREHREMPTHRVMDSMDGSTLFRGDLEGCLRYVRKSDPRLAKRLEVLEMDNRRR